MEIGGLTGLGTHYKKPSVTNTNEIRHGLAVVDGKIILSGVILGGTESQLSDSGTAM